MLTCTHTRTYAHMLTRTHTRTYAHTHTCTHAYMHALVRSLARSPTLSVSIQDKSKTSLSNPTPRIPRKTQLDAER
ncbi:hypothetical protein BO70DRAFT_64917 [Aspergillus heteromorphus CBS 117.55]|uniref:Uncharacterized protein n=1 Tax=Aspergillus heteromorphus CBS 117.55 TaxID=1448321 RepID=A0A317VZQ9_9EURO|nr:uncharacterized protein BO70DRAFT_64917 [Aspergillus heteromorphus CBS 117.55]PWY77380.1 hypothetical protein BO70DRAFT_64917 [Aspergillus heteromorphus CBS 117.55]